MTRLAWVGAVGFIELVVQEQVFHVLVGNPALVGIGGAIVWSFGDLDRLGLISYVDYGESVLVVIETNLAAAVFPVWTLINDTLG